VTQDQASRSAACSFQASHTSPNTIYSDPYFPNKYPLPFFLIHEKLTRGFIESGDHGRNNLIPLAVLSFSPCIPWDQGAVSVFRKFSVVYNRYATLWYHRHLARVLPKRSVIVPVSAPRNVQRWVEKIVSSYLTSLQGLGGGNRG
jgi:hypothetical protein